MGIAMAAAIMVAPLWCVASPAMPDYAAHLAGFYLIAGGAKLATLSQFYRIEWAFMPNLGSEILVPALSKILPLETSAKLFLSAGVVMWIAGPAAIHRALYGRVGLAPLFAAFFAYNANFMWGFFNYYFAAGLTFLVFAAWIATENKSAVLRAAGFALAATAVYFCHLFAAATLLLLLGSYEAGLLLRRKFSWKDAVSRGLMLAAIFLPAFVAFVFLKPKDGGGGPLGFNLVDTSLDRAGSAIQYYFDHPAYALTALLMILLAIGIWRRKAVLHPTMIVPLAALTLAMLFMPEWAIGGWGLHLRLPAVLGACLFAATDIRLNARAQAALASAVLAVIVWNAAALAGNWRYYDAQAAEFREALKSVPEGSKLMTVLDGDAIGLASDPPYWHMAEFAIVDRAGFTPLMFTTKGQHVVRLQPLVADIAAASAQQGSPPDIWDLDDLAAGQVNGNADIVNVFPYLMRFPCHFDEAVVIHLGGHRSEVPDMLSLRRAGSFFSIYDIRRTGDCAKP
jgi:hypothetical protein